MIRKHPYVYPNRDVFPSGSGLSKGLTKREYFAAKALTGLLANDRTDRDTIAAAAEMAVEAADELIEALNQEKSVDK